MAIKITSNILESYLNCKFKGHLKLIGEQGIKCDYETLLTEMRSDVRLAAIEKILTRTKTDDVLRNIPLTLSILKKGASIILDATLEDEHFCLHFDGLKKVGGPSKLGDFHYIPMLFHEGRSAGSEQRRLLELHGLLLSRLQGQMPSFGVIWQGNECRMTRLRLDGNLRTTERLLREVKEVVGLESPPKLILNDHCQLCEFRQRCRDQALQEDNISLLRGIGEKGIGNYARKGIFTVTQLAHTFRPRRRGKRSPPKQQHRYHALQALAVRDKRVYIFGTPTLPKAPVHIYLDIEGIPEKGFDYLIGIVIVDGNKEQHFSYWANCRDEENRIFGQFLETVIPYKDFLLFSYGSYERTFLQRMRTKSDQKDQVDRVLNSLVNTLSSIYSNVYFPTYSNGLKDIGATLGCSWKEPDSSGISSLVWRKKWETTGNEDWKKRLIEYNLEDCRALRRVTEFIYLDCMMTEPEPHQRPQLAKGPPVASVDEIDRLGTVKMRGRKLFFHDDFKHINACGRFDYQRQRVYVRLGKRRKKRPQRNPPEFRNRKLRVNQHVVILSRKCPSCGGLDLERLSKGNRRRRCFTKGKRAFDLVFTAGGVKRKVIECKASIHRCNSCGDMFTPERYERLAKHFHGLTSWVINEYVAYRVSGPMVSRMLYDLFGLTVHQAEIARFKPIMARYYRSWFNAMLRRILSSEVVQIDETEVRLRTGKGYVWVLTTSEEVVYLYRDSREGEWVRTLLRDFHGVLVSDFYAAYDSVECPQQKCLLHLMRDMNQELLSNPFDLEIQLITEPFGTLLRSIVTTIDEHGLKRRELIKHDKDVSSFFSVLESQSFRSDAAEALRARLMKNREKLFTFIHFDGVPWNNNTPENAIRRFAYYRDSNPGRMKEQGLSDYLVLLSLCQTCQYKNVSFLKFLVSGQKDVDAFRKSPKRKCRPSIEIYPKGVLRPDWGCRVPKQKTTDGIEGPRADSDNDGDEMEECGHVERLEEQPNELG